MANKKNKFKDKMTNKKNKFKDKMTNKKNKFKDKMANKNNITKNLYKGFKVHLHRIYNFGTFELLKLIANLKMCLSFQTYTK